MVSPGESVTRLLAAVNEHDLAAIGSFAPGNERFTESFRRLLTAFPDVRIDAEWTVTEADKTVAWSHIRGTHLGEWRGLAPAARSIDVHGVLAAQVGTDGEITDFWLVNDWLGIALQLGVELALPAV
jgi:predicted ester cyclase